MKKIKKSVAGAVIIGIFIYVFNFEYFGYFLGLICNSAIECVTGGEEYSNQLAKEMDTLEVSKFISLKVNGKEIDLDNTDFEEDFYHDIVDKMTENDRTAEDGESNADEKDIVTFYHGTSTEGAASIYLNGVDLNHADRNMDFGRGFYVTIDFEQAENWDERHGDDGGAVVKFEIPKEAFRDLDNKVFSLADDEWADFVIESRKGMTNDYDTVSGPMLLNPAKAVYKNAEPESGGQQTAFNSQRAVDLLNDYMVKE